MKKKLNFEFLTLMFLYINLHTTTIMDKTDLIPRKKLSNARSIYKMIFIIKGLKNVIKKSMDIQVMLFFPLLIHLAGSLVSLFDHKTQNLTNNYSAKNTLQKGIHAIFSRTICSMQNAQLDMRQTN